MPTKEIAINHALTSARQRYGPSVRILASSAVSGYCAIAVAWKGTGSVTGIALGRRSQAEADRLAIGECLKAAGFDPKVIKRWHG